MIKETRPPDKDEMAEPGHLLINVHDLSVDRIRVAGDEDAAGDRLLGGDPDQALAGSHIGEAPRPRLAAVILRRNLWRHAPRQELRHLRRLLEAGVKEPQRFAADPQPLFVGIPDIT